MFTSGGLLRSAQLTSVSAIRGHRLLIGESGGRPRPPGETVLIVR